MREHTTDDWQAFNKDQREIQARVTMNFSGTDLVFTQDDCLIAFNTTRQLTDTINTPFDLCCADTCSITFYNNYTGTYNGKQVEDYRIFDPLKNASLVFNSKIIIEMRALREDDKWSKWVPLGIFYLTDTAVDDDRLTVTVEGSDRLSLIFGKDIPQQPVYRKQTLQWFLTELCKVYNLNVTWDASVADMLQYAYLQRTIKTTIQDLVRSAACVATIHITDDLKEELRIKPFADFVATPTVAVRDYSNYTEEDYPQFITLRYNKSLLSYQDNTRVIWHRPAVSDTVNMYSYSTTENADFTYSSKEGWSLLSISKSELSNAPMLNMEYYSVCVPWVEGETANNAVYHTLLTQYSLTADARCTLNLQEDQEYDLVAYGRVVNNTSQVIPEFRPKSSASLYNDYSTIDTTKDYLEVDLSYCQSKDIAQQRLFALTTWANCILQTVDITLRGNPFIELMDGIAIDAQVYDIENFAGILWQETYKYQSGGLSVDAVLVNKEAFSLGIEVYDVAAMQREGEDTVSHFYIAGKCNNYFGLWSVPEQYSELQSYYSMETKLIGNITDMAVAFDGTWSLSADFKYYTFNTESIPWLFYCMDGKLYAKYGSNAAMLLADDAIFCAAERGYYPRDYEDIGSDQGLVVAYIDSSNKAWYRTYAYSSVDTRGWLEPEEISDIEGKALFIQIQRLNDYCIGICVTTDIAAYWFVSYRAYSQMAYRPELFKLSNTIYDRQLCCIITAPPYENPQPEFTWECNQARTKITLISDMYMEGIASANLLNAFTTDSANNKPSSAQQVDAYTFEFTFAKPIDVSTLLCTLSFTADIWFAGDAATKHTDAVGFVCIEGTWQHSFDFRVTNNGYLSEQFKLSPDAIDITFNVKPREIVAYNYSERIQLITGKPTMRLVVKPPEENIRAYNEKFTFTAGIPDIDMHIEAVNTSPI